MKKIAPDKWKHFYVGIAMGMVLQGFCWFLLRDHVWLASLIAFVLVVAISYGFELFSKFSGLGTYDIWDAVAGTAGGILGMGGIVAVKLLM